MIKLHYGYFRNNKEIILIMKFSNMLNELREIGNLYETTDENTFNICSIAYPMLSLRSNTLYLPGCSTIKDNDIIFFKMDLYNHTLNSIIALHLKFDLLVNKLVNTINKYNTTLTNINLKNEENIYLRCISNIFIMDISTNIINLVDKNNNNESQKYYSIKTDIHEFYDLNRESYA